MGADSFGGGMPWSALGAMAAVFALLLLGLRALRRWQPAACRKTAVTLLAVRRLGPRREVQELRVGDLVHTLYRQDGAMVLLRSEPWSERAVEAGGEAMAEAGVHRPRLFAMLGVSGGSVRKFLPFRSLHH